MGRLRRFLPRFSLRTLVVFLLLVTSGVGLWVEEQQDLWISTTRLESTSPQFAKAAFSDDGERLITELVDGTIRVWDIRAGEHLTKQHAPDEPLPECPSVITSPDGRRTVVLHDSGAASIQDARNDDFLALLRASAWDVVYAAFSPDGKQVATVGGTYTEVWRRRRPEWWWGVFWLWEFWLTVAFAGVFAWSVWRDRRALGNKPPSPRPESGSARPGEAGLAGPRLRATGDDVGDGG